MEKKTLIKGAFILMSANIITRLMGFYYRIYMSRAIGAEGIGLYQLIMPIYMLTWSITSSGLTTTVSKLTAQENAKGKEGNSKRILKIAVVISLVLSLILSVGTFIFADFIAVNIIKDVRTGFSLKILSFALPFMSLGSCIRGSFLGRQKQFYPAAAQVLEQTVKIVAILALASFFQIKNLAYACGAAVVGIVLGEIASFLFTYISFKAIEKKSSRKKVDISYINAFNIVVAMAMPLTLARVVGSLLMAVENILIPQRLALYGGGENALSIFGSLTGMALPLIQLPSAVLMAVSITIVPALSEAIASGQKKAASMLIKKCLGYTAIIGFGFAIVFAAFPSQICNFVYKQKELGEILLPLSVMCPLFYMHITISGILNGLGRHRFIFNQNLISSAINLLFIYFLMPKWGITALVVGMSVSLIITLSLGFREIYISGKIKLNLLSNLGLPLICSLSTFTLSKIIFAKINIGSESFIIPSVLMGFIYLILLLVTGALKKEDVLFLK